MSLYNMLFSRNPLAEIYLAMLGLDPDDVGRFRDCFLCHIDGQLHIVVYTRNGGGNREAYEGVTNALRAHKEYVTDCDDDFDSTYASYMFRVPEVFKSAVAALNEEYKDQIVEPGKRFKNLLDKIQVGNDNDPEVQRAIDKMEAVLEPVFRKLTET